MTDKPLASAGYLGYGWSDDIYAPAQQVDALLILQEEGAIQEILDGEDLTTENFLEIYETARKEVEKRREQPAKDEAEQEEHRRKMAQLIEDAALFGAQASARARHGDSRRAVVMVSCPDQPGVVAAGAGAIADLGGNIEGASMSIVADQTVVTFLVSGRAVEDVGGLEQRVATAIDPLKGLGSAIPVAMHDSEWPRPGSSYWHVTARYIGEKELLPVVTGELANPERELPIIALTSSLELPKSDGAAFEGKPVQVVDLNFALRPTQDIDVRDILVTAVNRRLPAAQVSIVPVVWPTHGPVLGEKTPTQPDDVVVTVLGQARPGFVNDILTFLRELEPHGTVRGATMAILEGMSVVTLVVGDVGEHPPGLAPDLERKLEAAMPEPAEPAAEPPVERPVVRTHALLASTGEDVAPASRTPTFELRLEVAEQPWVVARVARVLADAGVNITWFVSYVLEPVLGEQSPRCALRMHLAMDNDQADTVGSELRTLAATSGWGKFTLRPWSLLAQG